MPARRVIRLGITSHRVWPLLLAGAILAAAALHSGFTHPRKNWILIASLGGGFLLGGAMTMVWPYVTLDGDRFTVHEPYRPDALPRDAEHHATGGAGGGGGGTVGGMRGFQSVDGTYESRAPRDLPWNAPVPRALITGAAVRNGRLVVTLEGRKGRSIPLQGVSAADRNALIEWFHVPSAKR